MARFHLDSDVAPSIADVLRAEGHEVVIPREVGTASATDGQHLLFASQRNATFVTHSAKDFYLLHDAWRRWSRAWGVQADHVGIPIIPQRRPALEVAALILQISRSGSTVVNSLYRWQQRVGWEARAGTGEA